MSSPSKKGFKLPKFKPKDSLPENDPTRARVEQAANAMAAEIRADEQRMASNRARARAAEAQAAAEKEREDYEMEKGGRSRRRHKKTKRSTKKRRHTRRR